MAWHFAENGQSVGPLTGPQLAQAVAAGRVIHLDPRIVTLPGPWLDRALAELVAVLHGEEAAATLRVAQAGPEPAG